VLSQHYLQNKFRLVLNGDVEELKKFPLKKITSRWKDLYNLFGCFHKTGNLIKIAGNHDNELLFVKKSPLPGGRPLFESLSKIDSIKFKIEQLCRIYNSTGDGEKNKIEQELQFYKNELKHNYEKNYKNGSKSSLYNSNLFILCLFNSGMTIGKTGMTAIEITDKTIALVHWFDKKKMKSTFHTTSRYLSDLIQAIITN
jgi:hypothetical protein